ncbi:MAG TPA: hypothetical protein VNZ03_37650 [Terriglobales bacterium]|nr:hypothetical protein [Terriglobales bacterium]
MIASVLIILLAGSLRIHHIAKRSLWLDEAIAANISRGTLPETLILTRGFHSAPIIDPLILYAVERVGSGPLAVRIPSLVASVLAVFVMLCFVTIPSIDYQTAGLSALMLSVSAAQIRYAQEVREYSLSVLYAGVLLYVFLSFISKKEEDNSPIPLYVTLFVAPLVQYGLVLFSFGVLAALLIWAFTDDKGRRRITQIMAASGFLAFGGLLSFFLTLRYQWGDDAWYMKDYFWAPGSNIFRFITYNTHHLITFLLPGLAAASISFLTIVIYLAASIRRRILPPLAVLACTSCGTVLICSLLHFYPYGGIRQCLFLAPILCLLASASLVQVANRFTGRAKSMVFIAIVCVVVVSGVFQIRLLKPYAEIENIQQVLLVLQSHIEPGDGVYIYPGAAFAVDFYVRERDRRFIYGDYHQKEPEKHVPEILAGLGPEENRLWLVFSHIYRDEDKRILHDLSVDWKVEPVLSVTGSALYLATRRRPGVDAAPTGPTNTMIEAAKTTPGADHTHDSFWDWNVRNSRYPAH